MPRQHILWNTAQLQPKPRKRNPQGQETKYVVICQECGYERWLCKNDANRACIGGKCQRCLARANGKKTYARYGEKLATQLRDYRLRNPSSLEQAVMAALNSLGLDYEREISFFTLGGMTTYIDFKVMGNTPFFIEANGAYFHDDTRSCRDEDLKRSLAYLDKPLLIITDEDFYSDMHKGKAEIQAEIQRFNSLLPIALPF